MIRKRFTTDLLTEAVLSFKYTIVENTYKFYQNVLIELRDFSWFISGYLDNSPHMNIKLFEYNFEGNAYFSKAY